MNVTIYPGSQPGGINFDEASVVRNISGATVEYSDTGDPFVVEGTLTVGSTVTLHGSYFFKATETTLLSHTPVLPGGVPDQLEAVRVRLDSVESDQVGIAARVAVVEEHSPMGAVEWAEKYYAQVPAVYANRTVALEAAMAATDSYGGVVIDGGGLSDHVGELTFPAKPIELWGAARSATIQRWQADTASGTYAVKRHDGIRQVIRRMSVLGPVNAVIDGANANMWGVQHLGRNGLDDVHVQGFKAGIVRAGDHSWIRASSSKANRDGAYLMGDAEAGVSTGGNNNIFGPCEFDGNSRAGIAAAPLAYTFGEKWEAIHFGMGPVPIYLEVDGSNNAATLSDLLLDGCVFENYGNAIIYSASASATQAGTFQAVLLNCTGSRFAGSADAAPAGFRSTSLRNNRALLDGLASVDLACTNSDTFGFDAGPVPLALQHGGYQTISFDEATCNALASGIAHGAKFLVNPLGYPLVHIQFRERLYNRQAELHYCGGAITAGRLVYRSGDGAVTQWAANREVFGVALQTGAFLDFIPVGRKGIWPVANSATSAVAIGDPIIPDTVTADGKVTKATAGTGAIIGTAVSAGAAGATINVDFTPTGWRF